MKKKFDHLGYNEKLKELARNLRKHSTKAEIWLWWEVLRACNMSLKNTKPQISMDKTLVKNL